MDAIRDLIAEIDEPQTTDYWRVRLRKQRDLWRDGVALRTEGEEDENAPGEYKGGKWGQYIRGADSWFELAKRAGSRMIPLQELVMISRGFTSGADKFFCVRDVTQQHLDNTPNHQEFLDRWGISRRDTRRIRIVRDGANVEHLVEKRFLEPELHTPMEVNRAVVRESDVGHMVISASAPRARLRGTYFADYVAYAEREGWHTGPTISSRARTRPWYDLGLRPKSERADMFWPKAQQYRHVVPLNGDHLLCKDRLYDVWITTPVDPKLLWATLNSTIVMTSKHQFGRGAGIEGNLDTHVTDVNAMLVPDIREASPDAAARAIAACEQMSQRDAGHYLYEEFTLDDRRELDDATLEILGIEDADERKALRERIYRDVTDLQQAIREREIIAQQDRHNAGQRATSSPQAVADELWSDHESGLNLLQFPEDFVAQPDEGDAFDLPPGEVEVGQALIDIGSLLRVGTIRVGGRNGEVIDAGSAFRSRFLEALSLCHQTGQVRLPSEDVCAAAVSRFSQYRQELRDRCHQLAQQRTANQSRQRAIAGALIRKALQWRRS